MENNPRFWRISIENLPVLVAIFCGAALFACLIGIVVLYQCYLMSRRGEKGGTLKGPTADPINPPIPMKKRAQPQISNYNTTAGASSSVSSSVLDYSYENRLMDDVQQNLRTRSLPNEVHLDNEPNDDVLVVRYSKVRRNRMRNDEAAIIAVSKSGISLTTNPIVDGSTTSIRLTNDIGVVVYNERTAL